MAMFMVKPWYAKQDDLKIVPFSTGTDAQIKAMLDAYYDNKITWQDMGWAVGDTRLIHLNAMQAPTPNSGQWSAQDITVVIVAHDHTDLATAINGHTKACITVQTREVMNNNSAAYGDEAGHIFINGDSTFDKTGIKWSTLYMRTYLNSIVWGAISTDFKSAIRTSKHNRHTTRNTAEIEVVNDNLFLPSYPEIYGTASYSDYTVTSPVEGTQFVYYATSANRIKYGNNNGVPNNVKQFWWNGSISNQYSSSFGYRWCGVNVSGTAVTENGAHSFALAPAFAM